MSATEINQVLAQMRAMATQAQGSAVKPTEASTSSFASMLRQSLDAVNETQMQSAAMKTSFERGESEVSLAEVMIASQKARVSFEAVTQVRNRLVEAYKDVMNMPM